MKITNDVKIFLFIALFLTISFIFFALTGNKDDNYNNEETLSEEESYEETETILEPVEQPVRENSIAAYKGEIEEYSSIIDDLSLDLENIWQSDNIDYININQTIHKIDNANYILNNLQVPDEFSIEHSNLLKEHQKLIEAKISFEDALENDSMTSYRIACEQLEDALKSLFDPIQPIANYVE